MVFITKNKHNLTEHIGVSSAKNIIHIDSKMGWNKVGEAQAKVQFVLTLIKVSVTLRQVEKVNNLGYSQQVIKKYCVSQ